MKMPSVHILKKSPEWDSFLVIGKSGFLYLERMDSGFQFQGKTSDTEGVFDCCKRMAGTLYGYELMEAEYDVAILYKMNKCAKIYESNLEFAMKLFEQDLSQRTTWLISNMYENIPDELKLEKRFNELSKGGFFDDVI